MSLKDTYEGGLDVLGAGLSLGTFAPYLGLVGGALQGLAGAGGGGGGTAPSKEDTKAAIEKALQAEREKQAKAAQEAKAEAAAAKARTILYVTLGAVGFIGLGTMLYFVARKGK